MNGKFTKNRYVEYLNSLSPDYESEEWIIGGKRRAYYAWKKQYGQALREHDPIAFEVGYNDWVKESQKL